MKLSLNEISILGLLGITNRGEKQGGVLVVVGHPSGAILPPVEKKAYIKYGENREYDREIVAISPDHAIELEKEGWIKACTYNYTAIHYVLSEQGWKLYSDFEQWIDDYMTIAKGVEG